jgi:hypothetical protein
MCRPKLILSSWFPAITSLDLPARHSGAAGRGGSAHCGAGVIGRFSGHVRAPQHHRTTDQAIARFAKSYADQAEKDYETLLEATKQGKIPIETGI